MTRDDEFRYQDFRRTDESFEADCPVNRDMDAVFGGEGDPFESDRCAQDRARVDERAVPVQASEEKKSRSEFGNLFGGYSSGERAEKKSAAASAARAERFGEAPKIERQSAAVDREAASSASRLASVVDLPSSEKGSTGTGAFNAVHAGRRFQHPGYHYKLAEPDRRWAWLEIDLGAIRHNILEIRKRLSPGTAILAVVKANAYGHGMLQVADVALQNGASRLGVATIDEAIELREAGFTCPIQMLCEPPISSIPLLLEYSIIPAVYTYDFALALGEAADARGTSARYHIKVNTGMNRIGILPGEAVEFIQSLAFHRGLELEGIFTHFAMADCVDKWGFEEQYARFVQMLEDLRYAGIDPGIVHASSSAATIRFKKAHFDMVRVGIAMYGMHPSEVTKPLIDLRPAMEIHARVTQVSTPSMGEGVSYGFTYLSPGHVQIATLPLGYADGIPRILSNRMHVLLHGRPYPQVGNICMDQMMFEVTQRGAVSSRADVQIGDEVVVVGPDGGYLLTLDDMAEAIGTINYELACRLGLRLPHVFRN